MTATPLLETSQLGVTFQTSRRAFGPKLPLHAVRDVDLAVRPGETLAIVGESGSGKSTLARALLNLQRPTSGQVLCDGQEFRRIGRMALARRVQPVFQDPYSSLNPDRSIVDAIIQPLNVHRIGNRVSRRQRALEMMDLLSLSRHLADAMPAQLSGGQRQRVAIARALIMRPRLLVCDEPTSALDVSVQAQILNLLMDLKQELSLTYVIITHNLSVVRHMASRVVVMYLGRIVEEASAADFFAGPKHPYAGALLESELTPDPSLGLPKLGLGTVFPDPVDPPSGCHFHPRCKHAFAPCSTVDPPPVMADGHRVRCHLFSPSPGSIEAETAAATPPHP